MPDFTPQVDTQLAPAGPTPQPPAAVQQVAPNTYVTGFQDESVKQYEFELYSGRLNTTDRIYILRPNQIIKTRRHYHDKTKFVICNSVYERSGDNEVMVQEAECCRRLGNNSLTFGALILRYITDKSGNLIKPFVVPELRLWRFGVDKYLQLKNIDKDWKLAQHDLKIVCSDEKYQKMTIGAVPQCIYTLPDFPADLRQQFEQWASLSITKVPREMGKTMTDAEILAALGAAGAAAPTMTAGDAPIADFGSLVAGAKS